MNQLNRSVRSSSLVVSCVNSLLLVSFLFEVMVSMISFTAASVDFKSLGGLSVIFLSCIFAHLSKKACDYIDTK